MKMTYFESNRATITFKVSFQMNYSEQAISFLCIGLLALALYYMISMLDQENQQLRLRNHRLAYWLQLAEVQTGVPYYSATAIEALPYESNKMFYKQLQDQIHTRSIRD